MSRLAADSATPPELRTAAVLVTAAREFARELGLEAGQTYTTYSDVGRDTLLLVLTTSPRRCICPVTWWYPFVGRVPYRGFFDPVRAQEEAEKYRKRGYDVNLRPSAAFSTLGWFNDPLLSTAVDRDMVELAALVFHEIAHNTIWVKDATDFNESFAQWIGYRAAEEFFLARGDTALAMRAADRWHDEQILGRYFDRLIAKLDSLYATDPDEITLTIGRLTIQGWGRDTLASAFGSALRTIEPIRLAERPINNAALLGVRLYRTGLDRFAEWDWQQGRQLEVALFGLRELLDGARGAEAFDRLRFATDPAAPQVIAPTSSP
jgi:predicted aminopeptidase